MATLWATLALVPIAKRLHTLSSSAQLPHRAKLDKGPGVANSSGKTSLFGVMAHLVAQRVALPARRIQILEEKRTLRQLRHLFGVKGPNFFLRSILKCTAALWAGRLSSYNGRSPLPKTSLFDRGPSAEANMRNRIALIIALGTAVFASSQLAIGQENKKEPVYQGKPLKDWIDGLQDSDPNVR